MSEDNASNNELQRGLGRIEGKLDAVIQGMTAHAREYERTKADTDKRVRHVELSQAKHTGIGATLGAVGGFVLNYFIFHMK